MQAAGEFVILPRKFPTRMQPGQDQLNAGDLLFRMLVDRQTAPVIAHRYRAVLVQLDGNSSAEPGDSFIDAVVDDFLYKMVRTGCVCIHPWPLANRLQPGKDLDVGGCVA